MFNFPYTAVELTQQVNRFPNVYGLMQALGIFPSQAIASRIVSIRFEDGQLVVLAADEPGAPGQTTEREDGHEIFVGVPHFPHLETILARDLQGFLDVISGARVPKTFEAEMAKRLRVIRNNHAITREYVRLGALRGLIKDGKGRTLHNLFKVFNVQQKAIDFDLGNATSSPSDKCAMLVDWYGNNMKGETMSSIEVIVDGTFFSKLTQHPKVEKYWLQTMNAGQLARIERDRLGGQWGRVFDFQNIMFREYTGAVPLRDPATGKIMSAPIMGAGEGRAYPVGTQNSFVTYDGPVNHVEMVNEPGAEIFISPKLLDHGEGVEFKSQSNALPLCKRPEFLVNCSTSS